MNLISPYGGRVSVADERAEELLATGYRRVDADAKASAPAPAPAKDSDKAEDKKPSTPKRTVRKDDDK